MKLKHGDTFCVCVPACWGSRLKGISLCQFTWCLLYISELQIVHKALGFNCSISVATDKEPEIALVSSFYYRSVNKDFISLKTLMILNILKTTILD